MLNKFLTVRNILIALGVVIMGEAIWAGWTLMRPPPQPLSLTQTVAPQPSKPTVISLEAPKTVLKAGEKMTVSIKVTSTKKTEGTDLILSFDPKSLSLETTSTGEPVIVGDLYSDYLNNVLDAKNGKVTVSGITSAPGGVLADGLFGSIVVVAKAPGQANVAVEFSPGSTTDSNVIETGTGKDVLEKVKDLEINIIP